MRYVPRALLAAGLGLAAAFLAACGAGSGLLSASEASSLNSQLGTAAADLSNGDCVSGEKLIENIETQIANLPGSVNPTYVSNLSQGAQTVRTLANDKCGATVATTPDTTSTVTTTPTVTNPRTTSTSTSTTTTSTLTTPTTGTTTTPTTPTTPSTPATSTPAPGTTSTGGDGGGAPTGGGVGDGN